MVTGERGLKRVLERQRLINVLIWLLPWESERVPIIPAAVPTRRFRPTSLLNCIFTLYSITALSACLIP